MTAALLLALASSLANGAHVLRVVVIAAPASLFVELLLWPAVGASFAPGALGWGAASGVASAAAFALLYRTLAIGPMSVLSPVTALVSAALPVGVGLVDGERPGGLALGGMALALVAVVVVSGGTDTRGVRPGRRRARLAGQLRVPARGPRRRARRRRRGHRALPRRHGRARPRAPVR